MQLKQHCNDHDVTFVIYSLFVGILTGKYDCHLTFLIVDFSCNTRMQCTKFCTWTPCSVELQFHNFCVISCL